MKTYLTTLILVVTIFVANTIFASTKIPPIKVSTTPFLLSSVHKISFFNEGEKMSQRPLLEVTFSNVTPMEIQQINRWKTEIDARIKKVGKVETNDDGYHKLTDILEDYGPKFLSTSTSIVHLRFIRFGGFEIEIVKVHTSE